MSGGLARAAAPAARCRGGRAARAQAAGLRPSDPGPAPAAIGPGGGARARRGALMRADGNRGGRTHLRPVLLHVLLRPLEDLLALGLALGADLRGEGARGEPMSSHGAEGGAKGPAAGFRGPQSISRCRPRARRAAAGRPGTHLRRGRRALGRPLLIAPPLAQHGLGDGRRRHRCRWSRGKGTTRIGRGRRCGLELELEGTKRGEWRACAPCAALSIPPPSRLKSWVAAERASRGRGAARSRGAAPKSNPALRLRPGRP